MEERTKKTLEECKKLELKLTEAEKEKKNLDKKYTQVNNNNNNNNNSINNGNHEDDRKNRVIEIASSSGLKIKRHELVQNCSYKTIKQHSEFNIDLLK